jgi:NTP pyrophosphatase (non-canonical NTP hydrolase)
MTFDEYQKAALNFSQYPQVKFGDVNVYPFLGLTGEAGEVAEKAKKAIRDNKGELNKQDMAKELGDVLWYISEICNTLGLRLDAVASLNISKLSDREKRNKINGVGDDR